MSAKSILEVRDLSVAFYGEEILRGVSFDVAKGETMVIIGPNGAGKTVLFRALLGLVPYAGSIRWAEDARFGYIPQRLYFERAIPITVREFLLIKAKNFWLPEKSFLKHLSHELSLVGLDDPILSKTIGELSGGELQRVMIAWALLDHPDVLLFDEPTSGIDVGSEETIYNLVSRLQKERGTTVLIISHDLHVVYRYASHVLCLNREMVCYGEPDEVLSPQQLQKLYGESGYYRHHAH